MMKLKLDLDILNKDELNKLKTRYEEMISQISFLLTDSGSSLMFFGHFFMTLNKEILYVKDIKNWKKEFDISKGLVYIEGNTIVYIIDEDLINDKHGVYKLLFRTLHELIHAVSKHHSRCPENIKDSLIYNLAADQVTNGILYSFHNNKSFTNVAYFPEDEFFIKDLYQYEPNKSTESCFEYIKNNRRFNIQSKKVTVPLVPGFKLKIEEFYGDDELKNEIVNGIEVNIPELLYPDDPEFNLESEDEDVDIDDLDFSVKGSPFEVEEISETPIADDIEQSANAALVKEDEELDEDDFDEYSDDDIKFNFDDDIDVEDDEIVDPNSPQYTEDNYPNIVFAMIVVKDTDTGKIYKSVKELSHNVPPEAIQKMETEAPILYQKYKTSLDSAMKGDHTADGATIFDELFEIKYPWDDILANAICTSAKQKDELSWARMNKYYNHIGIPFPGQMEELVPDILVAGIDSSGSMSDHELQMAISIICDSHDKYTKLFVVVHDYDIKEIIEVTDTSSQDEIFDKINKIKGRGGTSHKDIFDHIEKLSEEYILSTIIFFTDYWSDVESIFKNYKFMKMNTTIWCVSQRDKDFEVHLENVDTQTIIVDDDIIR